MSKYFGFVDGKPYDFEFKKHGNWDHWKKFFLGEHFICYVIKDKHKAGWTVMVTDVEDCLQTATKVEGFVSRHACVDYALQVHPKTRDLYNEQRRDAILFRKLEGESL
ncbi:hypothetical protein HWD03_gp078 [Alteromonas phage vB_AmeM_PT11-V22]|uniref:Uncharacterized protein n=1 Tax=Alteromonas phage vB_AmeM_PT11-V22 TaxID=2704031 RepID=A0A6C0R0X2_9CAUD|nr:hypothetical protein HWD03_gp078 [Alteromonas phage vB_AmeM_PT11-V22]QHZ59838.1 hypothetical protein [Alteromonas phage vB_AmeM_PT11-V22]